MDQCWYGQFYQVSIRGPDCDTAPDPVADPRENDGRLWLWWGTRENERTASSPVADPKRMNGFGPRTGSRRKWTDGFGPCDGSEENERLRIRIDGSEDLTTQKRGFWYLLHSEIGSRASSKRRFYLLKPNNFEYSAAIAVFSYVQNRPRNERTDHYQQLKHKEIKWFIYFSKDEQA